ncbi:helix-turn-helix transcriptional regulator [Pedobacter cryoconitis]|uniref:AraC-like DNA-binding protein n=1 Tax=Pedobacter cryoconitis TaxID=188932 RepID=A0A327SKH4_9SPHI|nr:AraC family transcriptional regulator [Pedobacter cryoconitis]RAJ28394.1 AraC-like DNA-binding protein [Pedobacter cryoconitis]
MVEVYIKQGKEIHIESISIHKQEYAVVHKAGIKSIDSGTLLFLPDATFDNNFAATLPVQLSGHQLYKIGYAVQKILTELTGRSSGKYTNFYTKIKICELIVIVIEAQESAAEHINMWSKKDIASFEMVARVISQNLSKNISIAGLAERAGMNRTKLQAGFKEIMGQTINSYASELKMQKAKALLLNKPGYSLKQIAAVVGYSCGNHFSAAFKKKFSFSPSSLKNTGNLLCSILFWDFIMI